MPLDALSLCARTDAQLVVPCEASVAKTFKVFIINIMIIIIIIIIIGSCASENNVEDFLSVSSSIFFFFYLID